jgi:hypothetical protein
MSEDQAPQAEQPLPEEDKWLEQFPQPLHHIAKARGKPLFTFVMSTGAASAALGTLERRTRGNRELTLMLQALTKVCNDFAVRVMRSELWTPELIAEVRIEIERTMALAGVQEPRSASGLILPPN